MTTRPTEGKGDPAAERAGSTAAQDLARGTLRGVPFRLVRALLLALVTPLLRMRIEGLENVPASGAVVVVSNHLHNADPVLLSIAFPRPLHYMAKKEALAAPVIGAIIRRVGAFPVDRGKADRAAIRRAEATLAQGIAVGIFPEGTRSRVGAMRRAQAGAALLALRSGTPVLPATITGSERLPFNGSDGKAVAASPRIDAGGGGVRVRFGRPFVVPREVDGRRLSTEEATERMMRAVAAMLPPSYRGVYGADDSPEPSGRSESERNLSE